MEDIDTILLKRTSVFIFNILHNLCPTTLTGIFLSKSYFNDRQPDQLAFFDTSLNKNGKKCISNHIRDYVNQWNFKWLNLTAYSFKQKLREQFLTRGRIN